MEKASDQLNLKELSIAERILLVEEIWDSIVAEGEPIELSDDQKEELDRRMDDYRKSPEKFSTWDDVKRRIQSDE